MPDVAVCPSPGLAGRALQCVVCTVRVHLVGIPAGTKGREVCAAEVLCRGARCGNGK